MFCAWLIQDPRRHSTCLEWPRHDHGRVAGPTIDFTGVWVDGIGGRPSRVGGLQGVRCHELVFRVADRQHRTGRASNHWGTFRAHPKKPAAARGFREYTAARGKRRIDVTQESQRLSQYVRRSFQRRSECATSDCSYSRLKHWPEGHPQPDDEHKRQDPTKDTHRDCPGRC